MENVSSSNGIEKYPKLRFESHTDTSHSGWEIHTLADYLFPRVEKQVPTEEAPLMAFTAEGGVEPKGDRYDRSYLVKSDNKLYKRTELGDFIYSSNNLDVGSMGLNKYGTAVISDVYEIFSIKATAAPSFIDELIHRPNVLHKVLQFRQGCLYGQYRIYADDFLSVSVWTPPKIEQQRISDFFATLDKRIAIQKKLIEHLKKYKRGAINNIFNGYAFDESVHECLLSDVASFHQGLTYSPEDVSDAGYLVMRSSNIQNGRLSFADNVYVNKSISESLFVQENDVLMCVRNGSKQLVGKTAIVNQPYSNMTWGAFMMIIRSKLNNTFVYHYLNSDSFFNQVFKDSGTATINQITKGTLNECRLFMPKPEQQECICKYLDLLDEKLHKEEDFLESLKLLKKSLLQHLFI